MKKWMFYVLINMVIGVGTIHADPQIWMPDYFEDGNFPFHKHFGTLNDSFLNRIYFPNNTAVPNSNWVMNETGGEDGTFFGQSSQGNVVFTTTPWLSTFSWYMRTSSDGSIREVADQFFDENGPTCYVTMPTQKSIIWSSPGLQEVGDISTNSVSLSGTCGSGNGTSTMTILDYYPTFTIPAVTSSHGWSCPAATFVDVIKLRQVQEFNGSPTDDVVYWYAKDFGAIKLWADNGYVIRRICDADYPHTCQCAEDWMAGTGSGSGGGGPGGGRDCGPGTGIICP